ncbi:hypothetical protein ACQQ5V_15370 [Synechocystis sp. PCC 6803]|uniref:hypothetical protein n=1 Tax=Synechocystis sp. PCC 6803 TaxID=1148 RepID=UPI0003182C18|nr:hypothetical protein [Synechocystis sp. PCC 6803]MBD2618016.1 hypothetical protein [Synechocystis sp. FACHB-898]MBD2639239.1 hypothetical protein [Synechocystis sp. FACHB-908]MBD2660623.1 hypothetical protein [Synechocystis sp. FACHB-929]NHL98291.1 hypothetical protein [Synechocystis sp. PCC 6803]
MVSSYLDLLEPWGTNALGQGGQEVNLPCQFTYSGDFSSSLRRPGMPLTPQG